MERTVGPFSGSVVLPVRVGAGVEGTPTRKQVRGPRWRCTSHGFYVPADTLRTPEQRVAEASVVVPPNGALTGWAALRWMGGRWFEGTSHGGRVEVPVTIAVSGRHARPQRGISISEERLDPSDLVLHDGFVVTTAARSTSFEMRHASSIAEAVVAFDMAACSNLVSIAEQRARLASEAGRHGIAMARNALALAHENSWSPMETRLRLVWVLTADLPSPRVNTPVFDLDGRHLGTPDLLDLEAGLVVEFDGAVHLERAQRARDVGREDRFLDSGLSYLTVLGDHLHDEARLANRLRRARARALADTRRQAWTIDPPTWWTVSDTVARRRALRDHSVPTWPVDEPLPVA